MVIFRGSPYVKRNQNFSNTCPASPQVLRTGHGYRPPLFSPFPSLFSPFPYGTRTYTPQPQIIYQQAQPPTVIVDEFGGTTTVIESRRRDSDATVAFAVVTLIAISVIAAVAISISRDCKYIGEECSLPDYFGNKMCTPLYECKW